MKRGFSTLEIIIAMAIGAIVMAGAINASFSTQSLTVGSSTNDDAVAIAKKVIQYEQSLARQDFNLVNSTTSTEKSGGITYTKTTSVALLSDYVTKQVTTVISWAGEKGQALSTTLTSLITNLDNVNAPRSCNSVMTNTDGWKTPQDAPFDFQQLLYGNFSNGLTLSSVAVLYNKLYVVASSPPANPTDNQTFFVLNISGATPTYLGSIDNDADQTSKFGLNDIAVASTTGNKIYAFVANNNDNNFATCAKSAKCAQMQIIDATNSAAPSVVFNLLLATTSAPFVLGNNPARAGQAVGNSVFYANGYIYLGLTKTQNGPAFHIIDVRNPLAPLWIGSWPASALAFGSSGASINSVFVKGKYAYLSHPNGLVGATNEQLTVLDISNPAAPFRVSGFADALGAASAAGKGSTVVGSSIYFGRTMSNTASSDTIPEFYILNGAIPTSIPATPLGKLPLAINEGINNIVIRDFLAFLLTTTEFKIMNITNLGSISTWGSLPLPGHGGSSFDCEGDRFFIIHDVSKDFVSIVTPGTSFTYSLSTPANVTLTMGGAPQTTSFTTTTTGGTAAPVTFSSSFIQGVTMIYSPSATCTPSPTCPTTLQLSADSTAIPGTYTVTINSAPKSVSTSFTVTILPQSFNYSLSAPDVVMSQGTSKTEIITLTKTTSAAAQSVAVSILASSLPNKVTASPATVSCTPNNTCTVSFTITAGATAQKKTSVITANGISPAQSTSFSLTIQ